MNSNHLKRRNSYVPHKAAAEFKPTYDWSKAEAEKMFLDREYSFEVDKVFFDDCVQELRKLSPESIDMIVADPPFGLNFGEMEVLYNRNSDLVAKGYQDVEISDYSSFCKSWIKELPRVLKEDAGVWIFSGWTNLVDILNALRESNLKLINDIVWKYQFGVFTKRKFVTSHYHILFAVKDEKKYFFNKIEHYPLDVWEINRGYQRGKKKNATKLPIQVVQRCIDFGSEPGDLILDPFMGNGTTAAAALSSCRHFLGYEINHSLNEIIAENILNITLGQDYKQYSKRPDELVEKARQKFKK